MAPAETPERHQSFRRGAPAQGYFALHSSAAAACIAAFIHSEHRTSRASDAGEKLVFIAW
jgi:hypothetical protein